MRRTIVIFGLISGALSSAMMLATMPLLHKIGEQNALVLGYTAIVLSFLLVFFGIRSYRENQGNGSVTFVRGFGIGIAITLISCVFYVVTWEIVYFNFMPHTMDSYFAKAIEKAQHSGGSPEAIQAQVEKLRKSQESYQNPLNNAAMTFLEPFPVGLIMTLLSAAILRKKPRTSAAGAALPAV